MDSPTILVTGGTGTLGRPLVEQLRGGSGRDVRVLSRHAGAGRFVGDLTSGSGLESALRGVTSVIHLATSIRGGDARMTRNLIDAAQDAGVAHIVYISIVGIDKLSLGYYRQKLECERILEASPVPHTIVRATQVHELVAALFAAQRFSPVLLAPSIRIQPISVEEVAVRLVSLVDGQPAGRVADIGGPEKLTGRQLADQWKRYRRSRRAVWSLRLPGNAFRTLAAGSNLVDGEPYGVITFSEFLAHRVR
ncbi:NAD(P)H-binding protein [Diaminobutyricibacter tongyongensis]|uniref:NAD(P)H-binding protein n=1 Tax=Leifsonia tongyongensis TaxID=1268043 RepID=A0A6L9XT05_9MICO|nr:NAD(P)H-binding protein [Diaminobutyricibacter tongyongensis]